MRRGRGSPYCISGCGLGFLDKLRDKGRNRRVHSRRGLWTEGDARPMAAGATMGRVWWQRDSQPDSQGILLRKQERTLGRTQAEP